MSERDAIIDALANELALCAGTLSGIAKGFGASREFSGIVRIAQERSEACDRAIRLAFPHFGKSQTSGVAS